MRGTSAAPSENRDPYGEARNSVKPSPRDRLIRPAASFQFELVVSKVPIHISVIADSPSALYARRPRITHAGTGKNEGLTLCMSIAVSKRTRTSSAGPDQSPVRKPLYCCL